MKAGSKSGPGKRSSVVSRARGELEPREPRRAAFLCAGWKSFRGSSLRGSELGMARGRAGRGSAASWQNLRFFLFLSISFWGAEASLLLFPSRRTASSSAGCGTQQAATCRAQGTPRLGRPMAGAAPDGGFGGRGRALPGVTAPRGPRARRERTSVCQRGEGRSGAKILRPFTLL